MIVELASWKDFSAPQTISQDTSGQHYSLDCKRRVTNQKLAKFLDRRTSNRSENFLLELPSHVATQH